MDMNKDAQLTFEEFKEGSKQDPTIVQVRVLTLFIALTSLGSLALRWPRMRLQCFDCTIRQQYREYDDMTLLCYSV
jgi:hypothetical protein